MPGIVEVEFLEFLTLESDACRAGYLEHIDRSNGRQQSHFTSVTTIGRFRRNEPHCATGLTEHRIGAYQGIWFAGVIPIQGWCALDINGLNALAVE